MKDALKINFAIWGMIICLMLKACSSADAQNVFFPANPGDMIVKGTVGAWTGVPGGTAGCVLMSQGPTAAPTWSCALSFGFSLPPIATNRVFGNVSGAQAIPTAIDINQFLNTIGYDVLRPPALGSIPYLEPLSATWQALVPTTNVGWVLANQGIGKAPAWAFNAGVAVPGAAGLCLVSNGVGVAPTYQSCVTAFASTMTNGQLLVGQTGSVPLPKTVNGDGTLDLNAAFTLATVNSNVGSFGSATAVPIITVDGKGRLTAVSTATPTVTSVNGVAYPAAGTTGDLLQATAAGTMGRLAAVATGNVLRSGGVGVVSAWGKVAMTTDIVGATPVANGGTNCSVASGTCVDNVSGFASTGIMSRTGAGTYTFSTLTALMDSGLCSVQGDIIFRGAATWSCLATSTSGQVLSTNGAGANPSWIPAGGTGTVTNIATAGLATGGAITTTGTVTVTAVAKSDQTTGTSNVLAVTPLHQQDHDSAMKAAVNFTGSTGATNYTYNVTSVTRNSAGNYNVNLTTNFATVNYACTVTSASGVGFSMCNTDSATNSTSVVRIACQNSVGSAADPTQAHMICVGRQ